MKECKFCNAPAKEEDAFCPFCGYDPKIDTVSASFRQNAVSREESQRKVQTKGIRRSRVIRLGVKIFACIGLAIVIFSIPYKHDFNLNVVMSEIKQEWNGVISEVKQDWKKTRIEAGTIIPLGIEKKKESGEETEDFHPSTPLIMQGVVWGEGIPQAIINHKVCNIGDIIEGAKIIKISKKGVILLYKDRSYLLPSFVSNYKHD